MSSVAVLTPESFAEHRSGLKDHEMTGEVGPSTPPGPFLQHTRCVFLSPSSPPSSASFILQCPVARLRPGGRGLHPHLPGGLPPAAGEGGAGGKDRGAGLGVGVQDQAHQSLRHHAGEAAADYVHKRTRGSCSVIALAYGFDLSHAKVEPPPH